MRGRAGARDRRDARDARRERRLADPVAVAARAPAAARGVDDEVAAAAADEVDDGMALALLADLAHAVDGDAGRGERPGGARRGDEREAEPCERQRERDGGRLV